MKLNVAAYHFIAFFTGFILFLLYSYTQVDLGLTLTKAGFIQEIQKSFQQIGYFQRPVSASMFSFLALYFIALFLWSLHLVSRGLINRRSVWRVIIAGSVVLLVSYPAFSYDFFNYMFTAKTVLLYHKNPYAITPLMLSGVDPWLGFMHWTHAVSAYPPLWIAVTIIPYLLGFGYFLLILFNIKLVIILSYLLSALLLEKILAILDKDKKVTLIGLVLFALNPLVLVEILISGHNDIMLILFALAAYYFYLNAKYIVSFFSLAVSVALKTSTVVYLPLYLFKWNRMFFIGITVVSIAVISFAAKITGRDIQPWYFIILIAVSALYPKMMTLNAVVSGLSFGLLLQYAPFLYFGNWDAPMGFYRLWAVCIPVIMSVLFDLGRRVFKT